ncbi:hypothetical protein AK830_g3893 [Neonectria ditissima]|uniref:DUF7702 domain-containing protein n=1 Tax=Neonectria ditissima TaxID=78410 RepID=A0A0P7B7X5_9HYPO|nr:hypothetical protein AK830_g3893 [Neonectria ditissima]
MGHTTLADGIAIWQLVYYIAALGGSVWVSARHGFSKSTGWIFLVIFSIIRIVGCSAQIATVTVDSDTPWTIAAITGFLGLSPLLLASLGIVSRVCYSIIKTPWNLEFSFCVVKTVQVPAAVALILCIVGGVSADTPAEIGDQSTTQAGVILFLIVLVLIVLLTVGAAVGRNTTGRGEGRLLGAVAVSLPMLLIRIIYSFLVVFSKDSHFSMASGSTSSILTDLFMARIEEMLVILVYLWAGITQEAVPENDGGVKRSKEEKLLYRAGRGDFGGGKLGMASLAVHTLVGLFRDDKPKQPADELVEMNV